MVSPQSFVAWLVTAPLLSSSYPPMQSSLLHIVSPNTTGASVGSELLLPFLTSALTPFWKQISNDRICNLGFASYILCPSQSPSNSNIMWLTQSSSRANQDLLASVAQDQIHCECSQLTGHKCNLQTKQGIPSLLANCKCSSCLHLERLRVWKPCLAPHQVFPYCVICDPPLFSFSLGRVRIQQSL